MYLIKLNNLIFYSNHGVYKEENVLDAEYEINVEVGLNEYNKMDTINQTIDYVKLYEIINQRMKSTSALLETIAYDLTTKIGEMDKKISIVTVSIKKTTPPIANFMGSVEVSFKKQF